jgi:putative FmdB family regulatory protein
MQHQGVTAVPTYQYACTNPGGKHEFERVQSFTDAPVSECPECGVPVRKVYGSVGVVFKGSGFYRTDSRKAATASEGSSSNGSSSNGSSSSSKESAAAPSSSPAPASTSGSSGSKAAN